MSLESKTVLVWGAKGQFTVIRPILEKNNYKIILILDNDESAISPLQVPLIAGIKKTNDWFMKSCTTYLPDGFVVAIGGTLGRDRLAIAARLKKIGMTPITLIHHTAWVSESATIGDGCHILAQSAICENARLGSQVIVNTNASVDHDCMIGDGVHIMPGATLAGGVEVGEGASIGSNATILPRIIIGRYAVVGAGAVVTKNVGAGHVVVGSPAHPL